MRSPGTAEEVVVIDLLRSVLGEVGKESEFLEFADGTRLLVLPHGARVLGLFAPGSGENFLWTSPALRSPDSARALFAGPGWQNTGGDRTWLAPEIDFFLPEYPRLDRYMQPRQLDPGEWQVEAAESGFRLAARLSLVLFRSRRKVELKIAKEIFPAPSPLRRERDLATPGDFDYAGYTLRTHLAIEGDGEAAGPIGIWSLLQLPHGGELLVPTPSRTRPKVYFGSVGPDDIRVLDHLVRWRMRVKGEHKIGLRAVASTGRAGYLYPSGDRWALVIRNFAVNPSGEYVDVPWDDTSDLGYAIQACNVSSDLGDFSEVEHHAPAIGGGGGRKSGIDESQVWAFRGEREAIEFVARALLGPEVSA